MEDDVDYTIYCAIIQFHSDRAIANASFLIASVFGLFVILALMPSSPADLLSIKGLSLAVTYGFLWGFGLYSLLNFGYYADNAQVAVDKIKLRNGINLEKTILDEAYKRTSSKWFHRFKRGGKEDLKKNRIIAFLRSVKSLLLFPSYIVVIGLLPFVAINGILSSFPCQILLLIAAIYVIYMLAWLWRKRSPKRGGQEELIGGK